MAFVNLSLLVGGAFVVIPVVLHLIMRQRPKQLIFPALRFIHERRLANQRRLQLRHWLLLVLRCGAIGLFVVALARPSVASGALSSWIAAGLLAGLSALSRTVASRDQALATLLNRAQQVTKTIADRDDQLVKLVDDGNLLLQEIRKRREVIHALLGSTSSLAVQLAGLVRDNQKQLTPALQQLSGVVGLLQRNQDNLDKGIAAMAPFVRVFTNTLGNGRWFDNYIQNLLTPLPLRIGAR